MRGYFSSILILAFFAVACNTHERPNVDSPYGDVRHQSAPERKPTQSSSASNTAMSYTAPEEWQRQKPASRMRQDQYLLPGDGVAADAELAVFHFDGSGGKIDANVQRWYGQFVQPDGAQTEDRAQTQTRTVNGLNVTLVSLTGTMKKSQLMNGPKENMPGYAMMAAIAETPEGPWFFKAVGPESTIKRWQKSFDEFVASFRYK